MASTDIDLDEGLKVCETEAAAEAKAAENLSMAEGELSPREKIFRVRLDGLEAMGDEATSIEASSVMVKGS